MTTNTKSKLHTTQGRLEYLLNGGFLTQSKWMNTSYIYFCLGTGELKRYHIFDETTTIYPLEFLERDIWKPMLFQKEGEA